LPALKAGGFGCLMVKGRDLSEVLQARSKRARVAERDSCFFKYLIVVVRMLPLNAKGISGGQADLTIRQIWRSN
jgi:hypothetical protein